MPPAPSPKDASQETSVTKSTAGSIMQIPEKVSDLLVKLDTTEIRSNEDFRPLELLQRATNYLAASMIFLQNNTLLERPLSKEDIKERLLGHWGTCPGINFVYAHCNHLIKKHSIPMFLVTGPGHGAPANLANLFVEGSLAKFYCQYSVDKEGLNKLISSFSWPHGFPSHVNSEVPGQIHEGGELGYALSVSFGAIMDNPDLIVTCIVGDGEAETGPTAAAWHSYKYIDPAESGAVIPILHDNGFKISEETIYGVMDDTDIATLFTGFGYQVRIVSNLDDINAEMAVSMEWAYREIRRIQNCARTGNPIFKPRWPMIVLRTPKGWTGPKELHGTPIEGSFKSHQVPLPRVRADDEEFHLLESWLRSYKFHELIDLSEGLFKKEVLEALPKEELRMGIRKETYAAYKPLDLPDWKAFTVEKDSNESCMKSVGSYCSKVIEMNPKRFRIFSPDELVSNKLDAVFQVTNRDFQWSSQTSNKGGRVTEILSEHTCQGWMQGYTLTGRVGLFPSYETFLGIITTMMIQYAKFIKIGMETAWRLPIGSLNYIETSTLWRQEHNGFSHQNPSFLNNLINMKYAYVRIYLPADANCFLSTIAHCLRAENYINLMIGSKNPTPVWLSPEEAERHCIAGASVWKFASTEDGIDPDVVLVGCGAEVTFEVIAAASLLKQDAPELRVRVVNVTDLMILPGYGTHPHSLDNDAFDSLFTKDKPVIFNFHGYPSVIKAFLFDRPNPQRVKVLGYQEEGTTTTPFRMLTTNGASRFDVAIAAIHDASKFHPILSIRAHELISLYKHKIREHDKYIAKYGKDPEHLMDRPKF
ncbi:3323_t:CDS:10 [Funneliformis mosseae]|uniref:3323_t:CDS:1 n=1 Tax=Funneliformis mosseae TaxID=27381 RepID=A0A9N8ZSK5_FUNMO|nr:3323_t:CDS:10 [Funneliformis mosseae]